MAYDVLDGAEPLFRHCQLVALRSCWSAIRVAYLQLCRSGDAADLGPNLKGLSPGDSILGGWNLVSAEQDEFVDPVMSGEEALCLARRLEVHHLPLSPSRGLVRVLCPVVQAFVLPVLDRGSHLSLGRPVPCQLVHDHDTKRGVRPWGWTGSSCCFDRLPGVVIFELRGAEIAQCGM